MSTVGNYTDNPAPTSERRRHERQRLSQLAYLDLGPDNGGIVLDLTEDGMGFQALFPLIHDKKEVNLRIHLPHGPGQLETLAEIIWLGPENQQAGVCFRGISAEARRQIQEGIRAQPSPEESVRGSAAKVEPIDAPPIDAPIQEQEPAEAAREDKWLSLMADLKGPQPLDNPAPANISGASVQASRNAQDDSRHPTAYMKAWGNIGTNETPVPTASSKQPSAQRASHQLLERPLYAPHDQQNPKAGADGTTAVSDGKPNQKEPIDWPIRAPQMPRPTAPKAPSPRPHIPSQPVPPRVVADEVPKRFAPQVDSTLSPPLGASTKASAALTSSGALITPLESESSSQTRAWLVALILLTGICALCFAIGIWVGRPGSQPKVGQPPAVPAAAIPVAPAAPDVRTKRTDSKRASVNREKLRTTNRAAAPPQENGQHDTAPAASPLSLEPTPPRARAKESPTPRMALTPPEHNPTPTQPAPSSAPASPPVAASVPSVLAPRIVAGRKLKPSDRFNPCHLTYRVEPAYPVEAQQQRVEGVVRIHQVVGADGSVQGMKLLSGPPLLVAAAMDAAKYWRYLPALLNGQPVETEQDIEIKFRLAH